MDYEVKIIPEQKLGVINCKTPIEDLGVFLSMLMDWVEVEEIETAGDLFAIFYNNPRTAKENEVVYDVGIPINPELDPDETEEITYLKRGILTC